MRTRFGRRRTATPSAASALTTPTPALASFASPHAVAPTDLWGWIGLSMAAKVAKRTGSTLIDEHNDAISNVVAYLNGRALAAQTDEETAYLLRLRADVSQSIINPEDLAALDEQDADAEAADDAEDTASGYANDTDPRRIDITDAEA